MRFGGKNWHEKEEIPLGNLPGEHGVFLDYYMEAEDNISQIPKERDSARG